MKDSCEYAHNGFEVEYHPLKYKTKMCNYSTRDSFICSQKGECCSEAHNITDLRNITEILKKIKANEDFEEVSKPVASANQLASFNVETYRTVACSNRGCSRKNCLYYHDVTERRRDPKKFTYNNKVCKNIIKGKDFLDPRNCRLKDNCVFCHTKCELEYHLLNYKKRPCTKKKCMKKMFCPNIHKLDSLPKKNEEVKQVHKKSPQCIKIEEPVIPSKELEDLQEINRSFVNVLVFSLYEHRMG
jgi:hypothetical protein